MGLSARNRLTGTVRSVTADDVMAEVVVELDDGRTVTSTITAQSAERLGLAAGEEVAAVVKASDVLIETED